MILQIQLPGPGRALQDATSNFIRALMEREQLERQERRLDLAERRQKLQEQEEERRQEQAAREQAQFQQAQAQRQSAIANILQAQTQAARQRALGQQPQGPVPQAPGLPASQGVQQPTPVVAQGGVPETGQIDLTDPTIQRAARESAEQVVESPRASEAERQQAAQQLGFGVQRTEQVTAPARIESRIDELTQGLDEQTAGLVEQAARMSANGASAQVVQAALGEEFDQLTQTDQERLDERLTRLRIQRTEEQLAQLRETRREADNATQALTTYLTENAGMDEDRAQQMASSIGSDRAKDIMGNILSARANPNGAVAQLTSDLITMTGPGGERIFDIRSARGTAAAMLGRPLSEIEEVTADLGAVTTAVGEQDVSTLRDRLEQAGVEDVGDLSDMQVRERASILEMRSKYPFFSTESLRPVVRKSLADPSKVTEEDTEPLKQEMSEEDRGLGLAPEREGVPPGQRLLIGIAELLPRFEPIREQGTVPRSQPFGIQPQPRP